MRDQGLNQNHSSKSIQTTRVKVFARRKTVGITLPQNIVEEARKRNLNISRITEQALSSILDYIQAPSKQSSTFLSRASFQKESRVAGPPGIEPGTPGLKVRCFRRYFGLCPC